MPLDSSVTTSASEETREEHVIGAKARSAILWLAGTTITWQAVSWVITIFTARFLTPADYGLIALAETVVPYLTMLAELSIVTWIIQAREFDRESEKAVFGFTLLVGALVAAGAFFGAPLIARFYRNPEIELPFQVISVTFLLRGIYTLPDALLRRELNFRPIAFVNLFVGVSRSVLQLGLALAGFGYWSLVAGMVYKDLFTAIGLVYVRGLPRSFKLDFELCSHAIRFGLPATGATLCWIIFSTADYVVIGRVLGTEILGYYAMAFFLADLPLSKLNTVLRPVLIPYFSRLRETSLGIADALLRVARGTLGIVAPALIGLAAVATEAVPVIFGAQWEPMIAVLPVLCFVGLLRSITDCIPPLFFAIGKPSRVLIYNLAIAVVMPPSFYFLGGALGIKGIYASWLFVYPMMAFLLIRLLEQVVEISAVKYVLNLRAPLFAALLMGAVTVLTGISFRPVVGQIALLVIEILVGMTTYALLLWFLFRRETLAMVQCLRELPRE